MLYSRISGKYELSPLLIKFKSFFSTYIIQLFTHSYVGNTIHRISGIKDFSYRGVKCHQLKWTYS